MITTGPDARPRRYRFAGVRRGGAPCVLRDTGARCAGTALISAIPPSVQSAQIEWSEWAPQQLPRAGTALNLTPSSWTAHLPGAESGAVGSVHALR